MPIGSFFMYPDNSDAEEYDIYNSSILPNFGYYRTLNMCIDLVFTQIKRLLTILCYILWYLFNIIYSMFGY